MLEFYERLASQSDDDPKLLLKCAQARQRVGDIYQRLGKYDPAISSYRIAISDYENLAAHTPSNSFGNLSLIKAGLLNGIGSCELMLARQDASRDSHSEAMNLLNSLSKNEQQLPDVRYERARTHSLMARRLRPGESVTSQQFAESGGREFARGNDLRPGPGERFAPGERRRPEERLGPGQRFGPNEFRPRPGSQDLAETRQERFRHFADAIAILEPLTTEAPDVARFRFLLSA
jgi:tetratricopeptide (TPR) repeat protein